LTVNTLGESGGGGSSACRGLDERDDAEDDDDDDEDEDEDADGDAAAAGPSWPPALAPASEALPSSSPHSCTLPAPKRSVKDGVPALATAGTFAAGAGFVLTGLAGAAGCFNGGANSFVGPDTARGTRVAPAVYRETAIPLRPSPTTRTRRPR
jgi:hypothetical protein